MAHARLNTRSCADYPPTTLNGSDHNLQAWPGSAVGARAEAAAAAAASASSEAPWDPDEDIDLLDVGGGGRRGGRDKMDYSWQELADMTEVRGRGLQKQSHQACTSMLCLPPPCRPQRGR